MSLIKEGMWVVCSGDITDGFDFIGPFKTRNEALEFAYQLPHKHWLISEMLKPVYA